MGLFKLCWPMFLFAFSCNRLLGPSGELGESPADPKNYRIVYSANGATSGVVPIDESLYVKGGSATVFGNTGSLLRTGYAYLGWNSKADGTGTSFSAGSSISVHSDLTLYAVWQGNSYLVTFNPEGGTVGLTEKTVTFGQSYGTLPIPARPGFTFSGWFSEASGGGVLIQDTSMITSTGDHSLYAFWTDLMASVGTQTEIAAQEPSMSNIPVDNSDGNRIPLNAIISYKTTGGFFGKLIITGEASNYGVIFNYITYNLDGSIKQQGENITVLGTYTYDLDGDGLDDFQMRNQTAMTRDFYPYSGAIFYQNP